MGRLSAAIALLACLFVGAPPVLAQDEIAVSEQLMRADTLLKGGQAEQAYRMLAPLEGELAGNYRYDYLLGLAALESGRTTIATLALERVLLVKPNFAGARMDLARAYYELGDNTRAEAEFNRVLEFNPPPHVRQLAEQYLTAIEQRTEEPATRLAGYASMGIGYDTNVNNSPDQASIFVPIFGVDLDLAPTNRETADRYGQLGFGISVDHHLKEGLGLFAGADARIRRLGDASEFDQDNLDGRFGVSLGQGEDVVKVALNAGRFWLDESVNRDSLGLSGTWQHIVDPRTMRVLFGQYTLLRHRVQELEVNDVDQAVAGLTWFKGLSGPRSPLLFAGFYGGYERAVEDRPDGDKLLYGLTAGGQLSLTPQVALSGQIGYQAGDYDEENAAFLEERQDKLLTAKAGVNWSFTPDWSLRGDVSYFGNSSNIAIYEYNRIDTMVTVRREFR